MHSLLKQFKRVNFVKVFIIVSLLLFGVKSYAQQDTAAARKLTDRMQTELSLTGDQYTQVYSLNQTFIGQMKALQSSGGGRFSKLKKMKSLGDERDSQMKKILSDEQYQKYLKNKASNREKMKEALKDRKQNGR